MIYRLFFLLIVLSTFNTSVSSQQDALHLRVFSVNELLRDYDTLYKIITQNHPDLWAKSDSLNTEVFWRKTRAKITRPMKRWEFLELVAPVTTQYNDGHTALSFDFDFEEVEDLTNRKGKLFPYRVKLYNDTLWIIENWKDSSDLYKGSIVTSINHVPVNDIIKRILPVIPADHYRMKEAGFSRLFPFLLWSAYGWEKDYLIDCFDFSSNKPTLISTEGITLDGFFSRQFPKRKWNLQLFNDQSLAIISCSGYNNYMEGIRFIDSAFAIIKQNNIKHLAFDIRNNGGGNSSIGDHLLNYVSTKPYMDVLSKTLRNGPMMQGFKQSSGMYRSMQNFIKNGTRNGSNYTIRFNSKQPDTTIKHENRFAGNFYLLTSPITYSSAHMTALAVKSSGMGVIIGEPTGERIDLTGENATFKLPVTGLYGYCALALYEGAYSDKKSNGVPPDIFIPFQPSNLLAGKDPVIERLLALVATNK
ncbi:MAG: S41 family peptidase [Sediminibacterium sp.]|nr:S41 family peptidase [uncultured Sediminibacterium sp.]